MSTEQKDPKAPDAVGLGEGTPQPEATSASAPQARPAYRKPSITRHGNLRMMTQLE